jgi:hypothetical protein
VRLYPPAAAAWQLLLILVHPASEIQRRRSEWQAAQLVIIVTVNVRLRQPEPEAVTGARAVIRDPLRVIWAHAGYFGHTGRINPATSYPAVGPM